jgi:hypothetical protein
MSFRSVLGIEEVKRATDKLRTHIILRLDFLVAFRTHLTFLYVSLVPIRNS